MAALVVSPLLLLVGAATSDAQVVTLVAGGDIEWSRTTKAPGLIFDPPQAFGQRAAQEEGAWRRVPYVITAESKPYLEEKLGRALETPTSHHIRAIHYGLDCWLNTRCEMWRRLCARLTSHSPTSRHHSQIGRGIAELL
jgi:hypothetical protein